MTENMPSDDLRRWLELQAVELTRSEDLLGRYQDGTLPDHELTHAARAELFKGFEIFDRWAGRIGRKHMTDEARGGHDPDCPRRDDPPADHEFAHEQSEPIAEVPSHRLRLVRSMTRSKDVHPWMLRQAAKPTVTTFVVRYTCAGCGVTSVRHVAKVTFPWAGHTLTREFQL